MLLRILRYARAAGKLARDPIFIYKREEAGKRSRSEKGATEKKDENCNQDRDLE